MADTTGTVSRPERLFACLLFCVLVRGTTAQAQVTDGNGYITTQNWLVVGPFAQPDTCGGSPGQMLANYIAPTEIHCVWPEDPLIRRCTLWLMSPVRRHDIPRLRTIPFL